MTGGPQLMTGSSPGRFLKHDTCLKGSGKGVSSSNAPQVDHQFIF